MYDCVFHIFKLLGEQFMKNLVLHLQSFSVKIEKYTDLKK